MGWLSTKHLKKRNQSISHRVFFRNSKAYCSMIPFTANHLTTEYFKDKYRINATNNFMIKIEKLKKLIPKNFMSRVPPFLRLFPKDFKFKISKKDLVNYRKLISLKLVRFNPVRFIKLILEYKRFKGKSSDIRTQSAYRFVKLDFLITELNRWALRQFLYSGLISLTLANGSISTFILCASYKCFLTNSLSPEKFNESTLFEKILLSLNQKITKQLGNSKEKTNRYQSDKVCNLIILQLLAQQEARNILFSTKDVLSQLFLHKKYISRLNNKPERILMALKPQNKPAEFRHLLMLNLINTKRSFRFIKSIIDELR